ncbi:serine hydrolase [Sphingomonas mesophila]|uniref:serine hydrolase n=1 Tax=Sphingomonas mesophila TaxID=2303576 RepID=UPI0013C31D6D|nr:serine hydrolase [Sphingomonas mesophila]
MIIAATLAAAPAQALPAYFKARADALLAKAYPADGPGAVAVVVEKGRPIYAAGRGLADVERKLPLDPAMPFRLGSITKQFTAALILQLADEGKLSLDDPLAKFVPDFPKPGADVTVRQLLNHTAGIFSYTALPGVVLTHAAKPHSTAEMIALFDTAPPAFAAGSDWQYSNSGYVLLGAIVEKVTGKPWHVAFDERIASPLGLASLRYGAAANGERGIPKPYTTANDKPVAPLPIHMSFPHAAGALVGTAADLAVWARALHAGKVVKPASYQLMIQPTVLPGGRTIPYGFGLAPGDVRGRPAIGHDGGINGFATDGFYLPDQDIYVAVFANSDEPATAPKTVSRKLAALALGEPYEEFSAVPLDAAAVTPLLGVYRAGALERRFFLRDGQLFTLRSGGSPMAVLPAGGNRFFYPDSLSWFEIARGGDGKPVMRFHADGARQSADVPYAGPIPAEAPAVTLERAQLDRLAGRYQGPLPIVVAVNAEGRLTLKFGDQPITHLVAESATTFRVEEVDAKVEFQLEDGKAVALAILQGGRRLPAKRTD